MNQNPKNWKLKKSLLIAAVTSLTSSLAFSATSDLNPNPSYGVSIISNSDGTTGTGEILSITEASRNVLSTNEAGTTISIGQDGTSTNLNGATNNIGVNAYATTNNIGTGSVASVNNIGNTSAATTINSYAGNAASTLANNQATTTVGSASNLATIQATNSGATGFNVGPNGLISTGTTNQSAAGIVVVNAAGNSNGFVANQNLAVMSGGNGAGATSLTMSNNVATFANVASGAPIKVTGVADGTGAFDAVNYRQLQSVASGVAGTAAMANIPIATGANGKDFAVGVGLGNYMGQTSLALGGSYRIMDGAYLKASVASSNTNNGYNAGSSQNTVYGLGAGISF
ncbi:MULTISPECIES: YadA-like family protein [unclassified Polynucleobacter]|uniref:YadA-like family protein n=1 Tax=unclassified Polynucleobacter TaxID=2640945 RepID=UPI0008AD83C2|nr:MULTISPECIES: YadA-like family protein [unclassified Polynucleobacter]OHC10328.1 MAG: hypothetical protein A2X74_00320 [Polynucleobacter sp. GWA2_45_21]